MFSYYGSKSKIAKYYPSPIHDKIIEPFAGSAKYSLMYWEKDVLLVEKFHKVFSIWEYLQQATEKDILSLPDIGYKEKIPESLSNPEKWLIGYCIARGVSRPCTMGHKFNSWQKDKIRIASDLHKIKHWKIIHGDYEELENENASWFVDPPYFKGGYKYTENKINYLELADWCKSRKGQVIVCENTNASWLDFEPLVKINGAFKKSHESIWVK